jgi:hypothetical protein
MMLDGSAGAQFLGVPVPRGLWVERFAAALQTLACVLQQSVGHALSCCMKMQWHKLVLASTHEAPATIKREYLHARTLDVVTMMDLDALVVPPQSIRSCQHWQCTSDCLHASTAQSGAPSRHVSVASCCIVHVICVCCTAAKESFTQSHGVPTRVSVVTPITMVIFAATRWD